MSSPILHAFSGLPIFPVRPIQPPTQFPRTPDGLPPFGSQEAQQLRLAPSVPRRNRPRILARWLRGSHDSEEQASAAPSDVTTPPDDQQQNIPMDMLKRIFGMSRPVPVPETSANPRPKASLPPGVTTANSPGILALADDGTAVRGKFGTRASGHGIGSRVLDNHPMARLNRQAALEEEIQQIDKACARMDNGTGSERNHLRQLPQFPSIECELHRHVVRAQRERGGRINGLEPRPANNSRGSLCSPPMTPANSPGSPILSTNTIDSSMMGRSAEGELRSNSSSFRMREPGSYPPNAERLRETTEIEQADRMAGMRDYVRQGEIEQHRQRVLREKERREGPGAWVGCWNWIRYNCCDYDRRVSVAHPGRGAVY